jgi:ribonucleoside-diphosphate reductase alpha chain
MNAKTEANLSPIALSILNERYIINDDKGNPSETPLELFKRVAKHIASVEGQYGGEESKTYKKFLDVMVSLEFIPSSTVLMNAGTDNGQLSPCFVLPLDDSVDSIIKTLKDAVLIQAGGGGVGFSFSKIRPKGDLVKSTGGSATGPVPFIHVFDEMTECIKQSGKHRGANMGVLDVNHPDIEHFIKVKSESMRLGNFNLSVGITNEFMAAVEAREKHYLYNPRNGALEKSIDAFELLTLIATEAWRYGDPGVLFLDKINDANVTPHLGKIDGTNPCGETPLLPYESCVLGSINLSKMVEKGKINWQKLEKSTQIAINFLDNIIDINKFPSQEIEEMSKSTRKIGLGVMGWADLLVDLKIPYNSDIAVAAAEEVMEFINFHAKSSSINLAKERGKFPEYKNSDYDKHPDKIIPDKKEGNYILEGRKELAWENIITDIKTYGIRNATMTTIAPTGTISTLANTSSGIEPYFALAYTRNIYGEDNYLINDKFIQVSREMGFDSPLMRRQLGESGTIKDNDLVPESIKNLFVTAHEIDYQWHVKMQAAFQKYTDNAVSKTVNMHRDATPDNVLEVILLAHKLGCKGITVYRDGSRPSQILSSGESSKEEKKITPKPVTNGKMDAISYSVQTALGKMYLFIREVDKKPFDIFVVIGRSGSDVTPFTEAIGRLLSIALRSNVPVEVLGENLVGLGGRTSYGFGEKRILSVPDAIGKFLLKEYCNDVEARRLVEICPDCKNSSLEYSEGCLKCPLCGFSEC